MAYFHYNNFTTIKSSKGYCPYRLIKVKGNVCVCFCNRYYNRNIDIYMEHYTSEALYCMHDILICKSLMYGDDKLWEERKM